MTTEGLATNGPPLSKLGCVLSKTIANISIQMIYFHYCAILVPSCLQFSHFICKILLIYSWLTVGLSLSSDIDIFQRSGPHEQSLAAVQKCSKSAYNIWAVVTNFIQRLFYYPLSCTERPPKCSLSEFLSADASLRKYFIHRLISR